ncbi:type II secretion system F family protein [Henriciella barbarensis]|uniref:Type II secretion system F family protein n=1 Tax=Henriciella barbarensis TaxID=86342 RepID=A0A399R1A0_9PROT|nr:type II secretion system F family protein [Henriciella barbarensis]RIJ23647.1 type II secretion system F family protein [Henriciella barbarensis]
MINFISSLTEPATLASVLAAVAMFATILSVGMPLLKGDKLETRLKQVTTQRERLRRANRDALERRGLKKDNSGKISEITGKLNLQKMLEDPNVEQKLVQAGLRGPRPLAIFYFCRFVLPMVMALLAFVYIFLVNDMGLNPQMKIGAIVFGAAAGFYAPNLYVSNIAQKRQQSIMRAFPDALDMLLICVESGMSIELAFAKVGGEVGAASPDLAEEFQLTTAELAYLQERRTAYENLAKRTGHEGVKSVCMALMQAERYGTPLGDALRTMAKENRDMRMAEAEKKAAALPAKLTVPMILFFLPVLFLVVLGPAYIKYSEMQAQNQINTDVR